VASAPAARSRVRTVERNNFEIGGMSDVLRVLMLVEGSVVDGEARRGQL
jgi:hypothetical protein